MSAAVNAHMDIIKPIPFRSKLNKFNTGLIDYDLASPLSPDGSNFPCKGYHLDPMPATTPVEEWAAGSTQVFIMDGYGAPHEGGSCQASISEDNGASFKVIKSFIGGCPISGASFTFTVPKETKAGKALFAWTWLNRMGKREFYMNCAAVTITGTGGTGLSAFPEIFKANLGPVSPGCVTEEGFDVIFPNAGADIQTGPTSKLKMAPKGCGVSSNVTASGSLTAPTPGAPTPPAATKSICPPSRYSSSVPTTSTLVGTVGAFDGCVCSCGGPNGYLVSIKPAQDINNMINAGNTTTSYPSGH